MARMTKEELAAARAADAEQERLKAEAFRLLMPAKLKDLKKQADALYLSTELSLTETSPELIIQFTEYSSIALTYDTPEWEVEYAERELRALTEEQQAKFERAQLAKITWENLTDEQKASLRENMSVLK